MPVVRCDASLDADASRPIVKALFVASCLLAVVSWYTTQQGMALYLSPWFALLASLGIQSALVLTAWLIGLSRSRRVHLIAVYIVTALVSVAFSYVSLFTWFSARERPAQIERKLYDALGEAAAQTDGLLAAASNETQKHVLALEEMTEAERSKGFISKAQDADPFLSQVREAVAREAQTYNAVYKEGAGDGLRYTAFDRYTKLTRATLDKVRQSQVTMTQWRAQRKPQEPSDKQLRDFELAFAAVPWTEVEQALHQGKLTRPAPPAYSSFVDRTASGQEDMLVAFEELTSNPGGRPMFSLALAAFIDVVIFLLAYAAGPHLSGSTEHRWLRAGGALDGVEPPVFLRTFLRKLEPEPAGGSRVAVHLLTEGERQVCIALAADGKAVFLREGTGFYLIGDATHQCLLDAMASPSMHFRAQRAAAAG